MAELRPRTSSAWRSFPATTAPRPISGWTSTITDSSCARADRDDIEFAGWEVADRATLDRVAQQLEDGGVKVTAGTRDEADGRRVIDLIKCADPNGIPTEVFCGRPVSPRLFQSTPRHDGLQDPATWGWASIIYARNREETIRFYRDLLGFASPTSPRCARRAAWLAWRSSTAILDTTRSPSWRRPARQADQPHQCSSATPSTTSAPAVTSAMRHGVPIAIDLGRHMNDHMVSFYMANPSGFALEYGWGATHDRRGDLAGGALRHSGQPLGASGAPQPHQRRSAGPEVAPRRDRGRPGAGSGSPGKRRGGCPPPTPRRIRDLAARVARR